MNHENEMDDFIYYVFSSKFISNAIPKFKIDDGISNEYGFEFLNEETTKSALLNLLMNGGAYKKFEKNKKIAKQLTNNFLEAIIENRFDDFKIYLSFEPWNKWYCDVAWDYTYILIDKKKEQFWLFCITDTD